jgi:hypothetical protein
VTQQGVVKEDYVPPVGSEITVTLKKDFKAYVLPYELEGNLLTVTDNGTLPTGCYACEVVVIESTESHLRSMWKCQVEIIEDNAGKLEEYDTFVDESAILDAQVFYFAKGDKGDQGDQGEQGPPGTTDYNELENKPDLSVYLTEVTEEDLDRIFNN